MGGVVTHLVIAVLCLVIVHLIHLKWEFSWAVFVGNFVPDAIRNGFSALKQFTLAITGVEQDGLYRFLNEITSSYTNWFTLGFFLIGSTLLLYHFHYIKKKKMEEYDELYVFLLIGIVAHLIIDALIIETNPWL